MKNYIFLLIFVAAACKQRYEVFLAPRQTSFLVVEGSIITNGTTKINLSRTSSLDERKIFFEENADVNIEASNNITYPLTEMDSGRYELPFSNLDENASYRLKIKTRDNREYFSSYVKAIKTPEIDTITWTRYNEGIEIYANTKDPENNTQYYRLAYDETWEFLSAAVQKIGIVLLNNPPRVQFREFGESGVFYNDSIDNCWQFRNPSRIILASTTRLTENRVYMPLVNYPRGAKEFSHLYSINVKQFGISKEEYDFWQKMRKNTESLGTIFDAQPSELWGNIRCVTDTAEKVIGYVGATRAVEKRAFIDNRDLIGWNYDDGCDFLVIPDHPDTLLKYFYFEFRGYYLPIGRGSGDDGKSGILISTSECIDCTLSGTNIKPPYWP